jgi:hypothetical protein
MTGLAGTLAEGRGSLSRSRTTVLARWAIVFAVASAVVLGTVTRAWYLSHDPINADEALIGITARQILEGHFHAFLPGLHYEAVEPYLVAAVFGVLGSSPLALTVPVVLCDAAACILVWRIALRLAHRGDIAAICAAAMWAAPQSAAWNSTLEYGFRGVTLLCGTGMLLLSLRLAQGSSRWWDAPLLGALLGVGWWSSPEIVYFALPSAVWTSVWLWRARHQPPALARRAVAATGGLLAAGVGALPWLWDNVTSGFPSLAISKFDAPGVVPPYSERLGDFVRGALPMVLDLRVPRSAAWDMPTALAVVGLVVFAGAIAAAAVWQLWRRGDGFAVALAVLAYPFLLAAAPASAGWQSGRYTNFFVPLAALLAAAALGDASNRRRPVSPESRRRVSPEPRGRVSPEPRGRVSPEPRGRVSPEPRGGRLPPPVAVLAAVLLVAIVATSVVAFDDLRAIDVLPGARLGASPDQPAQRLASGLERAGVGGGYADYWVAYKLDFLTSGRLQLTDTPPSPDRLPSIREAAEALPARRQAWLFVDPTPTARTEYADTAVIQGPSGMTLSAFLSDLARLGVHYRVLHVAGAEAVVCVRPVTPADVGLRYPPTGG